MLQIALLLAFVIPAILFFLAQQRILQVISQENREMSPMTPAVTPGQPHYKDEV